MTPTRAIQASLFAAALLCLTLATSHAADDVAAHRSCAHCGMDRKAFGYSRMLVEYQDGATVGACSLHCAVRELAGNSGRKVKSLRVADRDTRELIDAETAVWVLGGSKPGVMTSQPKWAFKTTTSAEAFVKSYGGKIVAWPDALGAARAELAPRNR